MCEAFIDEVPVFTWLAHLFPCWVAVLYAPSDVLLVSLDGSDCHPSGSLVSCPAGTSDLGVGDVLPYLAGSAEVLLSTNRLLIVHVDASEGVPVVLIAV